MQGKNIKYLVAAVTTAALLAGLPVMAFSDIADSANAQDISYVTERGLFTGTSENEFAPQETLTRGMAVAVLARLSEIEGRTDERFTDVPKTEYYAPAVGWAAENGIVQGVSELAFAPERAITRDELAAILGRYWSWLGREGQAPLFLSPGSDAATRGEAASAFAVLDRMLTARDTKVISHKAADGVTLTGKLDLPADGDISRIVLFINGSGPNTYDNKRNMDGTVFNYFDLFAEQLAARSIGFFRWNTRGVSLGDQPPMYDSVDESVYQTYLPETSVSDIGEWIKVLKREERLKNAEVYLLGWSEGTIIAPLAAKSYPKEVDGLLLAGYCNENMMDILDWQQTGGSTMVFYRQYFDTDGDGSISKAEFEKDPYGLQSYLGASFEELDIDKDGSITENDFKTMLAPGYKALQDAVTRGDDKWLAENYGVRLTSAWFKAHEALAPTKEILPQLSQPIAIFHGTADVNCSVDGAYAIEKTFRDAGKSNLSLHVYDGYDHDLNYSLYPLTGKMPQSFEDIFQACRTMQ